MAGREAKSMAATTSPRPASETAPVHAARNAEWACACASRYGGAERSKPTVLLAPRIAESNLMEQLRSKRAGMLPPLEDTQKERRATPRVYARDF